MTMTRRTRLWLVILAIGILPQLAAQGLPALGGQFIVRRSAAVDSSTATITPNDATLVRFVVGYDNGVPYCVDDTSPYTCGAPTAPHATYYVRQDGNNSNFPCTANTAGGACLTIDFLADHASVTADDVIRVQAGHYQVTVSPTRNGTSGHPITIIADGGASVCGFSFSNANDIRIVGFSMNGSNAGCSTSATKVTFAGTNTRLEFWNNDTNQSGYGFLADGTDRCNSCIIFGGSIQNVNVGSTGIRLDGNDALIAYVNFDSISYLGLGPSGVRSRFLNLNFSNMLTDGSNHPDFFYISVDSPGFSTNLIESMFGQGTVTSTDNKSFHAQSGGLTWSDNVWRLNVTHNMGSGFYSMYDGPMNRWRFYNNDHSNCNRANNSGAYSNCGNIDPTNGGSAYILNNLFYQAWADVVTSGITPWAESAGSFVKNCNLAYDPDGAVSFGSSWTAQANPQTNVNPQLTNVSGLDFTLQSGSGARGVGCALTTTSGSGSNSTSLTLASNTGSFFIGSNASNLPQYGGALVPGDWITVGSTAVQVASVSGDVLTLATPISWSNGDPVYFGTSSTIDIGAYPYKAGGYTLSATKSGSPSANFSARVYPKYASQTLYVVAN